MTDIPTSPTEATPQESNMGSIPVVTVPLNPEEKIELELFRRVLGTVSDDEHVGTDLAQLLQTTTDLVASKSMNRDDAIVGLVTCLVVRVKAYRDECVAHQQDSARWRAIATQTEVEDTNDGSDSASKEGRAWPL